MPPVVSCKNGEQRGSPAPPACRAPRNLKGRRITLQGQRDGSAWRGNRLRPFHRGRDMHRTAARPGRPSARNAHSGFGMSGSADRPVLAHGSAARRSIERRNATFLLLAAAYLILFYALTNYYPLRQPRTLVSFGFESRIAMWPSTCWIYLSYFVLLLYTGLRLRRLEWTPRAVGAIAVAVTLSGIVFLFYPTTMIRPPLHGTGISVEALRWLRALDPPNNCFPSMHVAMAFLCFLLLTVANRRTGILILPWAVCDRGLHPDDEAALLPGYRGGACRGGDRASRSSSGLSGGLVRSVRKRDGEIASAP